MTQKKYRSSGLLVSRLTRSVIYQPLAAVLVPTFSWLESSTGISLGATGVARVLKAGGADDYATKAQDQAVWWPSDLIKCAKSMGTTVVSTS
jgi:hypothetical protein